MTATPVKEYFLEIKSPNGDSFVARVTPQRFRQVKSLFDLWDKAAEPGGPLSSKPRPNKKHGLDLLASGHAETFDFLCYGVDHCKRVTMTKAEIRKATAAGTCLNFESSYGRWV